MSFDSEMESLNLKSNMTLKMVEVEGVPFFNTIAENWDSIWSFKARPDDLIICTYPKSGTTWMQEIVDMIQQGGDPQKCARAPIYTRIPLLEMCPPRPRSFGFELAEAMPSPRSIKTHLSVQLLPPSFWQHNCKIIYVARNVKDCAVSYFYFHLMHSYFPEPGNWNQFLDIFTAGKVFWGSWFDHVRGWWEAKDHHPILYLFYEDIKEDPVREICKIAQFLGLELSEQVVNQIVQHTVFENMKVNPWVNYTTLSPSIMDHTVSPFMRKGTVGDWKEHFTVAQSEWLDDICARELEGSGLTFRTHL
ncbi:sulfotransferase 1C1-like [Sceloporus undulatus]|uniref:sulfotransferase 1C1-like n=1 Tax=Sceloporus undulatus TaxID=8520 RepID=UPI001C4AFA9B|nr:sulfotransferase 1C1-like [Sceloporus undulatus]